MKKKTFLQEIIPYLKFIGLLLLFIGAWWSWNQLNKNPMMQPVYSHKYICDGKPLDDECNYARWSGDSVLIKDCRSGNGYVCQSATEMQI